MSIEWGVREFSYVIVSGLIILLIFSLVMTIILLILSFSVRRIKRETRSLDSRLKGIAERLKILQRDESIKERLRLTHRVGELEKLIKDEGKKNNM